MVNIFYSCGEWWASLQQVWFVLEEQDVGGCGGSEALLSVSNSKGTTTTHLQPPPFLTPAHNLVHSCAPSLWRSTLSAFNSPSVLNLQRRLVWMFAIYAVFSKGASLVSCWLGRIIQSGQVASAIVIIQLESWTVSADSTCNQFVKQATNRFMSIPLIA